VIFTGDVLCSLRNVDGGGGGLSGKQQGWLV
jgi:hypothetical protein